VKEGEITMCIRIEEAERKKETKINFMTTIS
jgi:hypothetical protein